MRCSLQRAYALTMVSLVAVYLIQQNMAMGHHIWGDLLQPPLATQATQFHHQEASGLLGQGVFRRSPPNPQRMDGFFETNKQSKNGWFRLKTDQPLWVPWYHWMVTQWRISAKVKCTPTWAASFSWRDAYPLGPITWARRRGEMRPSDFGINSKPSLWRSGNTGCLGGIFQSYCRNLLPIFHHKTSSPILSNPVCKWGRLGRGITSR